MIKESSFLNKMIGKQLLAICPEGTTTEIGLVGWPKVHYRCQVPGGATELA
jgi:hypothetical protein